MRAGLKTLTNTGPRSRWWGLNRLATLNTMGAAEIAAMKEVFSRRGLNIAAQYLQTDAEVGYVVIDAEGAPEQSRDTLEEIRALDGAIRACLLYAR